MDIDEFEEDEDFNPGLITRCKKCGNTVFDIVKRKKGKVEDEFCELEEFRKCRECGKIFKQVWFSQHWEDADEEKDRKVIILENGAEVVVGKKEDDGDEGEDDPPDLGKY